MEIIRATITDLDVLTSLFDGYMVFYNQKSNPQDYRLYLQNRLENDEAIIFIAKNQDGHGMGFTLLYPSFSSVSQSRIFVLNDLFVHHDYRKMGIATALMNAAADFGQKNSAIRLNLETASDNYNAQKLYEKEGWVKDDFYHYSLTLPAEKT